MEARREENRKGRADVAVSVCLLIESCSELSGNQVVRPGRFRRWILRTFDGWALAPVIRRIRRKITGVDRMRVGHGSQPHDEVHRFVLGGGCRIVGMTRPGPAGTASVRGVHTVSWTVASRCVKQA